MSPITAGKAVRAALAMRETLAHLNANDAFGFGTQKIGIGVGIHTGLACVGNMGAESRFNYSAVGDAVNVAARIESSCKEIWHSTFSFPRRRRNRWTTVSPCSTPARWS